jgi:hypothetical protein
MRATAEDAMMQDFWVWASAFSGMRVQTITGAWFAVLHVDSDEGIRIAPESSGIQRLVSAQEFDRALALHLSANDLTTRRMRKEGVSEYNPSYVAAILRRYLTAARDANGGTSAFDHPTAMVEVAAVHPVADSVSQTATCFRGTLKSTPRPGQPDRQGRPTVWAKFAYDSSGLDSAKMFSCTFHGVTTSEALSLDVGSRLIVEGFVRPGDGERWDTLHVVTIVAADRSGSPELPAVLGH